MQLRQANTTDVSALTPLYSAFFEEDGISVSPSRIAENLPLMIEDERAAIIVADDGGRLAGFVSLSLTFGIEFGWAAEIEDLYVTPQRRGAGLARRLMNAALDWADARGATSTIAVVTPEAERSQGLTLFYRQFGFRDCERITLYRPGGDRASHSVPCRGLR